MMMVLGKFRGIRGIGQEAEAYKIVPGAYLSRTRRFQWGKYGLSYFQ